VTAVAELVCGTRSGYERHRRRGEVVDDACREAHNARERERRARRRTVRQAERVAKAERAADLAARMLARRKRVRPPKPGALGALAGTSVAHEHVPDGGTGTMCTACFGWCNDYQHTSTARAVGRV
jgi:hypothetical protein